MSMQVKGITIHNTGNELSAEENYHNLLNEKKTNVCHYLIDESKIINTHPIDEMAYHTGRGYDLGNRYTIAIEICRSRCDLELYLKAQKKAVRFIKKLMKNFNLTNKDIYFHCDFNSTRCPHRILEIYQTKERFINECKL